MQGLFSRKIARISLAWFAGLVLVPLLLILRVSLKGEVDWLQRPLDFFSPVYFENYLVAWTTAQLGKSFANSLLYSLSTALIVCLSGLIIAYPISRRNVPYSLFWLALFAIGLVIPLGLIPSVYLFRYLGLYNTYFGYVLVSCAINLPVAVFLFVAFIKTMPIELEEAAILDGCSYFGFLYRILIPLMKPAIFVSGLLTIISVWNDFINPMLFISEASLRPLTTSIYVFQGQFATNWPLLSAAIVMISLPLVAILILLQKELVPSLLIESSK